MDHSGAALLNNDDSSKQLGDINLSNIILNNGGTGKGIFEDDDEGLDAEAFIAQNTTNVRRRPTSSHKSRASKRSRKGSKHDEAEGIDPEDDDFINEVTEPMKAKTKNELLGRDRNRSSSRHSSKSRSRSRSNEISQRSQKKSHKIQKGNKIFNETSHRSLDKNRLIASDRS